MAVAVGAMAGCTAVGGVPPSAGASSSRDSSTANPGGAIDGEDMNEFIAPPEASTTSPDNPFASVATASLVDGMLRIEGTIDHPADVDVYDIGPVAVGDLLAVDVEGRDGLDATAALFDADHNLLYANDDRAFYSGLVDPKITVRLHRASERCYVSVAASTGTASRGDYSVTVTRQAGPEPGPPAPQTVYFNFGGAMAVAIGSRPRIDIPAFDGSAIGPRFADDTDYLIDRIMELVREDYDGLNVEFICSCEASRPAAPHTIVHFGAYDAELLGVADNVDEYNAQLTQQAIIFVDTFAAFQSLDPSVDEIAQAIANVASHETGHLLGLQHTHDPQSVMDVSANLRQMMGRQAFRRAPLDPYVFPTGFQDGPRLLIEAVGGDLDRVYASAKLQLNQRAMWYDQGTGPPARDVHCFSACFCHKCAKARAGIDHGCNAASVHEPVASDE